MKKLINLVFAAMFASAAYGQQAGARITQTTVGIYTDANKKIKVLLGESVNKLDTVTVADYVWYSQPYKKNPVLKIRTGNKNLTYRLKLGNIYMVYWNDPKKYWDVKKTNRRE